MNQIVNGRNDESDGHSHFKRSLLNYGNGESYQVKDTFFNRKGRFGRSPKHVDQSGKQRSGFRKKGGRKITESSFNCVFDDCSIVECKVPHNQDRIAKNIAQWKKSRGFKPRTKTISIYELCGLDKEEAIEIMFAERLSLGDDEDNDSKTSDSTDEADTQAGENKRVLHMIRKRGTESDESYENASVQEFGF